MEEWHAGESERGKSLRKGQAPAEHFRGKSQTSPHLHRPNRRLRTIDDGSQWHDRCCFQAQKFRRAERQRLVHQQCWLLWHVGDVAAEESRRPLSLSSLRWWLQESFTHNQGGISHLLSSLEVVSQQSQDEQPGLATSYTYSPASSGAFAILRPMSLDMSMNEFVSYQGSDEE
jgi:hypothetical protein